MSWSGKFHFGSSYAMYVGTTSDNSLHQHAAYQIAVSRDGPAIVCDENSREFSGRVVLVRPFVKHKIGSHVDLNIIYLDPKSPLLEDLVGPLPSDAIHILKGPISSQLSDGMPCEVLQRIKSMSDERTKRGIDSRLESALAKLKGQFGQMSISQAAKKCGLSESRLRVVARQQLGMPLSTRLLWLKLDKASKALASGNSLSDAASLGGFSDQAHFCRTMRRMFGVTPGVAEAVLK